MERRVRQEERLQRAYSQVRMTGEPGDIMRAYQDYYTRHPEDDPVDPCPWHPKATTITYHPSTGEVTYDPI